MKIILFLGILFISSYAISVTTCQNITSAGTYILQNDLVGANITPIPLRTNGCIVIYSDNVILDGNGFSIVNNATDDAVGIEINASNVEVKNFKNISAYAFAIFGVTGVNNSIHNSSILFNQAGAAFYQMNDTSIYNNSVIDIVNEGIAIGYSHNLSIYDNYFYNQTKAINATSLGNTTNIYNNRFNYTGYAIAIQNAFSNISYNNIFNSTYGIGVFGDNSLYLKNTIISNNNISAISQYGIQLQTAQNSTVSFNDISNSFAALYSVFDLMGPNISNNIIHNNTFGDTIESSNHSSLNFEHYYQNIQDVQLTTMSSDVPLIFNATNIIFDNPSGNFQNFTNISINDILDPRSRYFFKWSNQPAALNLGDTSFNNKYLNFSSENESKLIDEITWYWSTAEESGYTPADLRLKFYNGSWQNLSSVPNTMTRTLTATNLNTSGTYSILQVTTPNCPIISSPGIYTMTNNFTGAPNDISEIQAGATTCLKFATSNIDFDCNGYSLAESGAAGLNWAIASNSTGYSNITIRNCRIENYDVGINLQSINNTLIYNNTINNTVYTPISVNTANNVVIANNLIMNAINTQNTETNIHAGSGNLIENNSLSNGYGGIYLRSDNSIIRNNNITFHGYEGINIGAQTNISIYSNFINNTGSNGGIYLIGTTNSQVFNNSVYNSVNYGITAILSVINVNITNNFVSGTGHGTHFTAVFNSLIANNTFTATTGHGMFVQSSSDNFLADNVISAGTANGIYSVGSARNIFKWNNITSSSGQYGIFMTGEHGGDVIEFNNITNFTNAGVYAESFDNIPTTISYNIISNKGTNGISINGVNSVNIVGNWLNEGSYGLYCNSCSLTNFTNNTVDSSTGSIGVWLIGGNYNKVTNNNFSRYSFYSIASEGSQYDIIASNFVNASGGQGIGLLSGANYNNVTANNVINAQYDYHISGSNYAYLANNYASAASSYSYYCINSNYGSYTNLSANLSSYGAYLSGCSYTTINNLTSYLNSNAGTYVTQGSTNTIENSSFFNNTNYGVYFSGSPSSSLRSSTMYNQVYGLYALYTIGFESNRIFYNNSFYQNQYGAHFQYTTNDYVELSSFFNNSEIGFSFQDNRNLTLTKSEIYNNTLGAKLYGATFTNYNGSLTDTHFYNNLNDLQLQSNGGNTLIVSLNGVLFDNPVGNLTAYTNLSINDTVGAGNNYLISWSPGNSTLPANVTSFRQKFVNMTINSGTPSIDQIQWSWTAAETIGYNETNLTIYNYNGTNWTKNGGTLNTGSHTLSLSSLSISNAIYGIMDDETPTPVLTTLVYFVSPTPDNNTNITTTPVVIALNHINGTLTSPCLIELNGMNQTGSIAGDACSYSFTPTINNTNYTVKGYMNLSGTMIASNETRTFTWFSTPALPAPSGGGNTGNPVGLGYLNQNKTTNITTPVIIQPSDPVQQYDYKCILLGILLLGLWFWARRKQ